MNEEAKLAHYDATKHVRFERVLVGIWRCLDCAAAWVQLVERPVA